MTFSLLENKLLMEAIRKPRTVTELQESFSKKGISRSGFYKALGTLKRKEVVIVKDKVISPNKLWLADSYVFFRSLVAQRREPSYLARQVTQLGQGEDLVYTFRSISEIDIFLINIIYDLLLLTKNPSILIEEEHEFFLFLNTQRTKRFVEEIRNFNVRLFLLTSGANPVDKEILRQYLNKPAEGYAGGNGKPGDRIIHAVGDIIIELHVNKQFAAAVRSAYAKHESLSDDLKEEVEDAAAIKRIHRMRIYKDAERAKTMRNRFKKYFVL